MIIQSQMISRKPPEFQGITLIISRKMPEFQGVALLISRKPLELYIYIFIKMHRLHN
jgi:hypothetical protein